MEMFLKSFQSDYQKPEIKKLAPSLTRSYCESRSLGGRYMNVTGL